MRGPPPPLPSRGDPPKPSEPAPTAAVQQSVLPPPPPEMITQAPLPPPLAQHTVFLPPVPQVAINQGCDCNIPVEASQDVKLTRYLSIAVIITHSTALIVYGYINTYQIVASLIGIISGGILLCCYQKGIYCCTPIMFIIAAVFDLTAAIIWLLWGLTPLSFLAVLGLAAAVAGSVFGFKSCCSWDDAIVKSLEVPTVVVREPMNGAVIEHIPPPAMNAVGAMAPAPPMPHAHV